MENAFIIESGILRDSITALDTIVDEAVLNFTKKGVAANAVDVANVAMVGLSLDPRAFDIYDVAQDYRIGVDIIRMKKALALIRRDEKITIEFAEIDERGRVQKIRLRHGRYSSTLKTLDPDAVRKEPKQPILILPATIRIDGVDLKYIINSSSEFSDNIRLATFGQAFVATAEGDLDAFTAEMPAGFLRGFESEKNVYSTFSLDYLKQITKFAGRMGEVEIRLGQNYPYEMIAKFAGGRAVATFRQAPRIESK